MTSEGSFIQPAIPRFDGHYDHWSMLMENFLRSKEFWELVESGYIEPSSASAQTEAQRKKTEEMKLKDLKVKNYLFQAIDRTVLDTILKKDTAKDIWDAMKKKFEGNAKVKRSHLQALRREFETLEMRSSEGVTEYFSRVMTVANKMRLYGEDMQDVKVVEKILRSLTEKFNYVVCSIEESKDIDALTVDELQSSLIVHEQKFQRRNGETCDERDGSSEGEDRVRELQQSRERQPPMWMGDYVSGEGLSDDEVHMPIVTLSTTEAEFVAAAVCACQGVWIKRILKELGQFDGGCTTVMCDNSSTIKLSKNPVMHGRSKHIDVRFHFLRNLTKEGVIELVHCGSQDQVADIMTKPLKLDVFQKLRKYWEYVKFRYKLIAS
ncbi:hypothetical protein GH714_028913 [Hevea brasiliensis]|uniref:DUF4219 domain-containing protein n=1 Tax=Hevea brasiliensis TaxID=3981 RepID=A0A6A6LNU9_HEVBR|nr:hypothetical protein GH714_028913 [Hevea brasiliensis]